MNNNQIENNDKISDKTLVDAINVYRNLGGTPFDDVIFELLKELRQYRKDEEKGMLLRLPTPLGSEVWEIFYRKDDFSGYSYPVKARTSFRIDMLNKIGKTIFLTEEDVEKARLELS